MNRITSRIGTAIDTRQPGYRTRFYLAYPLLFVALAGDAVRYTIGWAGWAVVIAILIFASGWQFFRNQPLLTLRRVPFTLYLLLALMLLSALWSNYPLFTLIGFASQVVTTITALFLVSRFDWRELLRLFSNVVRVILVLSFALEYYSAAIVKGPIAPIFKNFTGDEPVSGAYYWVQAHLFTGQRIQGIVGNATLLGYIAMIGCVFFIVEFAIRSTNRWLSTASFAVALAAMELSKSAGIFFAVIAVIATALVAGLAEGRSRNIRHRLYRVSWVVAFMAVFYMLQYRDAIFEFVGKSPDASGRGHIWYEVGKLIAKRPVQGWGWIGYWMPGAKPLDRLVKVDGVQQYHAHDAYLDVTMQLGVIGLLLFLLMLALSFIKLWRLAVRHNNALYLWPLLVFAGILVLNITESRMLVENGWMIIVLFMVKVNEPKDRLEPSSNSVPPLKRLIERINQLRQRLRE